MKINETQLEQVNDRIQALVRSNSFYGKKLEAAGMTEVHTPEEFAKLKSDRRYSRLQHLPVQKRHSQCWSV